MPDAPYNLLPGRPFLVFLLRLGNLVFQKFDPLRPGGTNLRFLLVLFVRQRLVRRPRFRVVFLVVLSHSLHSIQCGASLRAPPARAPFSRATASTGQYTTTPG